MTTGLPHAPLQVLLVTPAERRSRTGNRVTALRIAAMLRSLGHRVRVREDDDGRPADLLLAVHARKSALAVASFAARAPGAPVVVLLAGTDVYPRLDDHADARAAVARAQRLVVLQPLAAEALPMALRDKVRVVLQSASSPSRVPRDAATLEVCVLAHLREVKDPLLAAQAVALLPRQMRVRVRHAGGLIEPAFQSRVQAAASERYQWLGPLSRQQAKELLAASHLLVVSSRSEGGANVLSEAIAAGVGVLATDVPGNTGILGHDHPGLFPAGDAAALAALLGRAATEPAFLAALERRSGDLQPRFEPARERAAWAALLAELFPGTIERPCAPKPTP
jgi:putative glycosyltransferase (TIGR04348 family)